MKKLVITATILVALSLMFVLGFAADPGAVPEGYQALADQIKSSMTDNLKSETIRKGADLQYMAKTYYGDSLGWPLVWFFNTDTVSNPEVVEAGTKLKIPRLKAGISPDEATKAIENAYILVYYLYANDGKHTKAQRQWVLGQARSAGLDLKAQAWAGILGAEDLSWLSGQKSSPAKTVIVPKAVVLDTKQTRTVIALAAKADEKALEDLILKAQSNNTLDDLQGDLEAEAAKPEADIKPEIHFALALTYGRKGLKTQEYAALVRAEEAAKKPGVNFNISIVYGRKQLLESDIDADKFMVGALKITNAPDGAIIAIDGVEVGKTPDLIKDIKAGKHSLKLNHEWYEELEGEFEIAVGREARAQFDWTPRPVSFDFKTNAESSMVTLRNLENLDESSIQILDWSSPGQIKPGTYEVKVEGTNRKDIVETITLKPGEKFSKNWNMELGEHEWYLTSNLVGSKVILDGKEIGYTPVSYSIFPGKHQIQIEGIGSRKVSKTYDFTISSISHSYSYNEDLSKLIPTKQISLDGKNDDWADVFMVRDGTPVDDIHTDVPGDHVVRFALAQDNDFLYVYLEFDDGLPKPSGAVGNFVVQYFDSTGSELRISIDRNQSSSQFGQSINVKQSTSSNGTRLWGGDNSDFTKFGTNFIETKFPKKIITERLKLLKNLGKDSMQLHILYANEKYAYRIANFDPIVPE